MSTDTSLQLLLAQENAMRFGATEDQRKKALEAVIEIALYHPQPSIREHARQHLLVTKRVLVEDASVPVEGVAW